MCLLIASHHISQTDFNRRTPASHSHSAQDAEEVADEAVAVAAEVDVVVEPITAEATEMVKAHRKTRLTTIRWTMTMATRLKAT